MNNDMTPEAEAHHRKVWAEFQIWYAANVARRGWPRRVPGDAKDEAERRIERDGDGDNER